MSGLVSNLTRLIQRPDFWFGLILFGSLIGTGICAHYRSRWYFTPSIIGFVVCMIGLYSMDHETAERYGNLRNILPFMGYCNYLGINYDPEAMKKDEAMYRVMSASVISINLVALYGVFRTAPYMPTDVGSSNIRRHVNPVPPPNEIVNQLQQPGNDLAEAMLHAPQIDVLSDEPVIRLACPTADLDGGSSDAELRSSDIELDGKHG